MDITEILKGIAQITDRQQLELIGQALKAQHRQISATEARINQASLKPGDRVRTHNLSPKYLNGKVGVVVAPVTGMRRGDIRVEFSMPMGRYGTVINVPASALEAV